MQCTRITLAPIPILRNSHCIPYAWLQHAGLPVLYPKSRSVSTGPKRHQVRCLVRAFVASSKHTSKLGASKGSQSALVVSCQGFRWYQAAKQGFQLARVASMQRAGQWRYPAWCVASYQMPGDVLPLFGPDFVVYRSSLLATSSS